MPRGGRRSADPHIPAVRPGESVMVEEQAVKRVLEEARNRRREFPRQGRLTGDIVHLLKQAGIFPALVARRFGGEEMSPSDFCRLVERISAADGSTGWIASFGHAAIYL